MTVLHFDLCKGQRAYEIGPEPDPCGSGQEVHSGQTPGSGERERSLTGGAMRISGARAAGRAAQAQTGQGTVERSTHGEVGRDCEKKCRTRRHTQ